MQILVQIEKDISIKILAKYTISKDLVEEVFT